MRLPFSRTPATRAPLTDRDFALQRLRSVRTVSDPLDGESTVAADKKVTGLSDWQVALLRYAESVPPLAASGRYYAAAAQRVSFSAEDANGNPATGEIQGIIDILNNSTDAISRGVQLLFLVGDTRGLFDAETSTLLLLSPGELFARGADYVRVLEGPQPTPLTQFEAAWRSYEPSLVASGDAVSSNKALLDVFEAYRIAYGEERALSIRSAMNAGVTLISEDIFNAAATGEHDANGTAGMDPADALEERIRIMLQRTITNPRNSAAFAPPVLTVPGSVNDKVLHVGLAERRDTRMLERRLKALREEIAIGIDLPADVAAGFFADMNHWNGFLVNENAITNHIAPKIELVVNDAFHEIGAALNIDTAGWVVVVDYSDLMLQADMSGTALDAHDRGLISDFAARDALGFEEDDAPSVEHPNTNPNTEEPGEPTAADDEPEAVPESAASARLRAVPAGDDGFPGPASASAETRAVTFRLSGQDAVDALDEINPAMTAARSRMQRDVQSLVNQLFKVMQKNTGRDKADEVTAAAGPGEQVIIDNIAKKVLKAYNTMSLGAARGLATKQAKEWYSRTLSAHSAAADAAAIHAQTVVSNIVSATVPGGAMPSGMARQVTVSVESVASGGKEALTKDGAANGIRPGIISEDEDWLTLLNDEFEGDVEVQYTWAHGGSPDPFPPHEELDGEQWVQADELEVLANPNDFPDSAVFYPGDHQGCTCEYDADMIVVGGS